MIKCRALANTLMDLELYRTITNHLNGINVFSKRLEIQILKQLKNSKKDSLKFSLATCISTYPPRMSLRSISKVDEISGAEGTIFLVISQYEIDDRIHSVPPTFPNFT